MAGGSEVSSPDGARWRVRRRWLDRRVDVRGRFRRNREEGERENEVSLWESLMFVDLFNGLAGIAVGVALVVLAFVVIVVLLPLLGLALELILLLLVFTSGLFGRLVLGRPWTVEAVNLDDGERSVAYAVRGFGDAGRAVEELASAIRADGPPERLSRGEQTVLPRPGI